MTYMGKYSLDLMLDDKGSADYKILNSVKPNSVVLEFGCANGRMTRYLKEELNCTMYIVEFIKEDFDEAVNYAEKGVCGDILDLKWLKEFEGVEFDYILFADVLEHLYNPLLALESASKLLKDNGQILLSVPNIAHNSVIIDLIQNKFEYRNRGLLDNTHIRFFTYDSLMSLISDCGLVPVEKHSTNCQPKNSEFGNDYSQILAFSKHLENKKYGTVYQFVVKLMKRSYYSQNSNDINIIDEIQDTFDSNPIMYIDYGNGFNEEDKTYIEMKKQGESNLYIGEVNIKPGAKCIRFDPVENKYCILQNLKIFANGVKKKYTNANGFAVDENEIFLNYDPQILCEISESDTSIRILCEKYDFDVTDSIVYDVLLKQKEFLDKEKLTLVDIDKEFEDTKTELSDTRVELSDTKTELSEAKGEIDKLLNELDEVKSLLDESEIELEKVRLESSEKSNEYINLKNQFDATHAELVRISTILHETNLALMAADHKNAALLASHSWKITKPMRFIVRNTKKFLRSFILTRTLYKGLAYWKNHGFKAMLARAKERKKEKKKAEAVSTFDLISNDERKMQSGKVFSKNIKFSVIVPLYNTPKNFLIEMIQSVKDQTYSNWELCLADGSDSSHTYVEKICKNLAKYDKRIKYKKLEKNLGISENTNAAIEMATGEFIALFDHDDLLHPSAFYYYMFEICDKNADFVYCDEMTFSESLNNVITVHCKPSFALDNLRANNYICHFTVFSKDLLKITGAFRKEFDGSQDHDMILRLTEEAKHISRVPKILYFWRSHPNSVAMDINSKTYAIDAGKKAVREHIKRSGQNALVESSVAFPTIYKINYEITEHPLVSIIIPNKDQKDVLKRCIDSIVNLSTYKNYEIIIVENNSETSEIFEYYDSFDKTDNIKVVYYKGEFNYSKINNFGFEYADGEQIILLNNDVEVIANNWIEEMLMYSQRDDVGAVGAKLYYPDNTIQHAGIILGLGQHRVAGHGHYRCDRNNVGYMGKLYYAQNMTAVTAACMMIKRSVFEEVEGLDSKFQVAFNDVDFCLRIRKAGYMICWTPYAELYHYESLSRGLEDTTEKKLRFEKEADLFRERWKNELEDGDPYYNPNFTLDHSDYSLK